MAERLVVKDRNVFLNVPGRTERTQIYYLDFRLLILVLLKNFSLPSRLLLLFFFIRLCLLSPFRGSSLLDVRPVSPRRVWCPSSNCNTGHVYMIGVYTGANRAWKGMNHPTSL